MLYQGGSIRKLSLSLLWVLTVCFFLGSGVFADKSKGFPYVEDGVTFHSSESLNAEIAIAQKDIFVMFYAPWCGHCKAVAEKWLELAKIYMDDQDVIQICKLDASEDSAAASEYSIPGFPTFKLIKTGPKKEILEYSGPRNVADFVSFMNINTKASRTVAGEKSPPFPRKESQELLIKKLVEATTHEEKREILKEIEADVNDTDIEIHPQVPIYGKIAKIYVNSPDGIKGAVKNLKALASKPGNLSSSELKTVSMSLLILKSYKDVIRANASKQPPVSSGSSGDEF